MQYYYHDGKAQKGPYTFNELISLGIEKKTKVWREGLENWKDAGELEEFRDILKDPVTPPPFQQERETPPPFVQAETKPDEPKPSINNKTVIPTSKKPNYSGVIIAFAVIGILATGAFFYSQYLQAQREKDTNNADASSPTEWETAPREETYEEKKMSIAEQEAAYPKSFLSADGTYRQTLLGQRFAVEIDVSSTATVATYKDINIEFVFYTRTGTEISRETYTFYEYVKPGRKTHISTKISRPSAATQLGFEVDGALSVQ